MRQYHINLVPNFDMNGSKMTEEHRKPTLSKYRHPGQNGASAMPRKKRVKSSPVKLWVIAVKALTTAQAAIHPDINREGRSLVMSMSGRYQLFLPHSPAATAILTGRNLAQDISHEQNRDACLILDSSDFQLPFEPVKSRNSNGISIKEIEPVHEPENGQNVHVKLPNKLDLGRVDLCMRACVVKSRLHFLNLGLSMRCLDCLLIIVRHNDG